MSPAPPPHSETQSLRDSQRAAFGTQISAEQFHSLRPGYPEAIVDWVLNYPSDRQRVLDLGAGTGKMSHALICRGHEVVAVEPSEGMRAEFARRQPNVEVLAGSASDIPLPDASVDAVVVAQAWHWVDEDAAGAEIARVLRPGGPVGIVWNVRDEKVDWIGQINQAVGRSDAVHASEADRPVVPNLHGPFTDLGEWTVPNQHALPNADAVANLAGTWSYVQTASNPDSSLRTVRKIAAAHAAVDGTVVIPQVCVAFRAFRVA